MKIRLLAFVLLLSSFAAKAQYVTIPDANFVAWLNANGYSQCMNGNQMDTTCNAIVTAEVIYCPNASISNITGIQYFDALRALTCKNNPITAVPNLPSALDFLDCSNTIITALPNPLPPMLMSLNCSDCTGLTQLPPLPSNNFQNLVCSNSGLSFIPALPSTIYSINIGGPSLQALPEVSLYPDLASFAVDHVNFDSLPQLPNSLKDLSLFSTEISYIPNLPDTLTYLMLDSCPNLYCLPPFKHTDEFSIYETPISCFSSMFSANTLYQPIDGIPLCQAGNTHGCQVYDEQAPPHHVIIPDPAFASWLYNNGFSQCMSGNLMDTTCVEVITATNIDCRNSNISSIEGIQYFDNLGDLMVEGNNLPSITALPPMLTGFYCDNNQLTSLPALPTTLTYLDCCNNFFTALPTLPPNLVHLFCHEGNLSQLPVLPATLETLECYDNNLTVLPAFPSKLRYVDLHMNQIGVLPTLGDSIRHLDMYENALTSVPPLSAYLEYFDITLNQIANLPTLPMHLKTLQCSDNQLVAIPNFPAALRDIGCMNNQLTSLPQLPDTVTWLYCSNNPNLACLPMLTNIGNLYFENTAITCKPNQGNIGSSSPSLDTIPLCDIYNGAACEMYWNLKGKAFTDLNTDCIYNNNDAAQLGIKLNLWSNGVLKAQTLSNSNGDYSFHVVEIGNYEIRVDTVGLPFDVVCPQSLVRYVTFSTIDTLLNGNDFSLRCKAGFDIAAINISSAGIFRPANNTVVNIHAGALESFYGTNCSQGVAGTVRVTISSNATYLSPAAGATAPSNVNGNVLTWNVADFGTTNALTDFNIVVRTDTFAQIGQQVCFTVRVTPTVGDNDSSNNTLTYCFPIVNSYDPNDKTAYPSGDIDTVQEWLTYRVRFQNTGNAEAQHIYIMDTLDTDVDASTFQLLAYSHQPNVEIKESIVRFNFPNINLPDSFTNEPGSHGYVQYKVKLKENLPIGTTIENTAYIYFDFNPPVVTNTTTNTIAIVQDTTGVGIKQVQVLSLNIYPNPANSQVTITTSQAGNTIYMYTAQGQLLSSQAMQGTAATINIDALPSGIYYVEVNGSNGAARKKLVKL